MEHDAGYSKSDGAPGPSWWDSYSDQPRKLPAARKPRLAAANLVEYGKVGGTAIACLPVILWRYHTLRPTPAPPPPEQFVGLSVSPGEHDSAVADMVADLGVGQLLVRVPVWDLGRVDRYLRFTERFPHCRFVVNVLQNRASVLDPDGWASHLREIFTRFGPLAEAFQVGNASNRTKWGCAHSGEYLRLLEIADAVRREFPGLRLAGSSVIDFEPLVTLRTLVNGRRYQLDACAAQLYVNRRGSPTGKQYGFFDLARKIRLIAAILSLSGHCSPHLWITETNWPLLDTKPWTPNSGNPRSTVDEPTQAEYLTQYFRIAYQSGLVDRVYWWQLIAPGYGLVDHRGGRLRRHPSYTAFRELLRGGLD